MSDPFDIERWSVLLLGRIEAGTPGSEDAIRAGLFLDKIRNMLYVLILTESLPARRLPGPGEEKPRLFEMLQTTTPART